MAAYNLRVAQYNTQVTEFGTCSKDYIARAHLDLGHDQRGIAGIVDPNEGVGGELAVGVIRRLHRFVWRQRAQRKMECEQKPACQTARSCASGESTG